MTCIAAASPTLVKSSPMRPRCQGPAPAPFPDLLERPAPLNRVMLGGMGLMARSRGLSWSSQRDAEALLPQISQSMAQLTNPNLQHPSAYPPHVLREAFHGYPHSNYQINSSLDQESAMRLFAGITMKDEPTRSRSLILNGSNALIANYYGAVHAQPPAAITDLGCGTGASSAHLCQAFPQARIIGLDASPVHLAEAMRTGPAAVTWRHALAEASELPEASQDLVTLFFTAHEQPKTAMQQIASESLRILRPGGVFAVIDTPQESGAPNLLTPLLELRTRLGTEPFLKDFRETDFVALLRHTGFENVQALPLSWLGTVGRKP